MPQISLFASAVRPALWEYFFVSLRSNVSEIEVIFAGNAPHLRADDKDWWYNKSSLVLSDIDKLKYIETGNIKPAQCYEIARRECQGEVVVWVADDCEFPNGVLDKAYAYWKAQNNEKLILSIQTKESGYNLPVGQLFDMNVHRLFAGVNEAPLMAPLGMMSRKLLDELGGIDRRYVCGQYENDVVMRACAQGAKVEVFGDKDTFIDIDHLGKSLLIGESKVEADFLNRPFAKGYPQDRAILENSWANIMYLEGRQMVQMYKDQRDKFEPYSKDISLTVSESNKGVWA